MSLGNGWTVSTAEDEDPNYLLALHTAKGKYQQDLVLGVQALSGETLRGKAGKYPGRYHNLRQDLFLRLTEAGVTFSTRYIEKQKRLVIGAWPEPIPPEPPRYMGPFHTMDDLFR